MSASTPKLITYRKPEVSDGDAVYRLIQRCPPLDCNSIYSYFLWCRDFSDTSIVAIQEERIVGFISGYLRPEAAHCLFIWQVAVAPEARKQGLAGQMLDRLAERPHGRSITRLETTVSPSNLASRKMFRGFAKRRGWVCYGTAFLSEADFSSSKHEAEDLIIITPLEYATQEDRTEFVEGGASSNVLPEDT